MPADAQAQPHDRFFKQIFSRKETAAAFFQAYLPPALVAAVDWPGLEQVPGSFVDAALRHQESDLLYRAPLGGEAIYFYFLFEHQRRVDPWMAMRMLGYLLHIWQKLLSAEPRRTRLPMVVPLVLYQGATRWSAPVQLGDLIELPRALREELGALLPRCEHLLVDLSQIDTEQVRGDLVSRLALSLMKAAGEDRFVEWIEQYAPLLGELGRAREATGILRALLSYFFATNGQMNYQSVQRVIERATTEHTRNELMSIAQQLIEQGKQEGLRKGELIGTIQTLETVLGLERSERAQLEGQSLEELTALAESLRARLTR